MSMRQIIDRSIKEVLTRKSLSAKDREELYQLRGLTRSGWNKNFIYRDHPETLTEQEAAHELGLSRLDNE